MTIKVYVMACPRCDRPYKSGESMEKALELVKVHVVGQHPDHDPYWFETYPDSIKTDPIYPQL